MCVCARARVRMYVRACVSVCVCVCVCARAHAFCVVLYIFFVGLFFALENRVAPTLLESRYIVLISSSVKKANRTEGTTLSENV